MADFIRRAIRPPGVNRAKAPPTGESTMQSAGQPKGEAGKTGQQQSRLALALRKMAPRK